MRLLVEFQDGEAIAIERPGDTTCQQVLFTMQGTTAVFVDGDVKDLPEVVGQVEDFGFVNAVEVEP